MAIIHWNERVEDERGFVVLLFLPGPETSSLRNCILFTHFERCTFDPINFMYHDNPEREVMEDRLHWLEFLI